MFLFRVGASAHCELILEKKEISLLNKEREQIKIAIYTK